jgi:alcohol dehydrogenase (cytochrome c)
MKIFLKHRVLQRLVLPALVFLCAALSASAADGDWAMYNKDFQGQRYSPLDQINAGNVGRLKEVCRIKLANSGSFHSGLIVVDGVMYVTTARLTLAIDPRTCDVHWRSVYVPEEREVWAANRGAALMDGRLFRGTADGRVLALDAKTGKLLWKTAAGNPKNGEFFSSAPIAWKGLLFIGVAGGDWGVRGRMMAFDAQSGKEVWRFNTVPAPGEPGFETWEKPETTKTGGGGTWGSYALDAERGEVFVPVANPAPDFLPSYRPGANLYTNSVVVLDAKSGKLKWWYQVAPSDGHDYGIGAAPMLYRQSGGVDAVVVTPKDGFLYAIDRATHKLLFKTAVTTIENAGLPPTPEGRRFCPGAYGGTEWNGAALDAKRRAIFVGTVDWCAVIKSETPSYTPGNLFMGGSYQQLTPARGWVNSLDPDTGKIRWKYQAEAPVVAGVTPTAGGVVLTGDMSGNFLALDSSNGKLLYKFNTGGAVAGGVITYAIGGKQYVATTSGNISRLTFGALGSPTVIVMALDDGKNAAARFIDAAKEDGEVQDRNSMQERGWRARIAEKVKSWGELARDRLALWTGGAASAHGVRHDDAAVVARGQNLFALNCAGCHGPEGGGLSGPSLKSVHVRLSLPQTVDKIKNPKPPMPALYPSLLSEQDVRDVAAYLHTLN